MYQQITDKSNDLPYHYWASLVYEDVLSLINKFQIFIDVVEASFKSGQILALVGGRPPSNGNPEQWQQKLFKRNNET